MGVIRKKTASRGTEAGTKYHCDICSVDVTSTVRRHTHIFFMLAHIYAIWIGDANVIVVSIGSYFVCTCGLSRIRSLCSLLRSWGKVQEP